MEENEVKICPKCGSTDSTIPPSGMDLRMSVPDYCRECEFSGNFLIININNIKEFRNNLEKQK